MPLRPDLYNRLMARFPGGVIIANEGEEMTANIGERDGRKSLEASHPGEVYRVSCIYCGDTRHRLYINHMWGHRVKGVDGLNLYLAICFNETSCMSKPGRAMELYRRVFGDIRGAGNDPVYKGLPPTAPIVAESPGLVYNLADLPADHPAHHYVRRRGFDPVWLGRTFQVGHIQSADYKYRQTKDRLYIPVMSKGRLAGWQARYLGDPVPQDVVKYFTMPGMPASRTLYNYDLAQTRRFVVVVEGPSDVWKVGPEAVAVFKKHISTAQLELLAGGAPGKPSWAVVDDSSGWEAAVVLLDGDASQRAEPGEAISAADKAAEQLAKIPRFKNKVVVVRLPPDADPGSLDTLTIRQLLAAHLAAAGLSLPI